MKLKLVSDTITGSLDRNQRFLTQLPQRAFDYFIRQTPKDTGRARSNTRLQSTTIEANYPYAQVLDSGSSRQAPQGMTKPTQQYLNKLVRQSLRK